MSSRSSRSTTTDAGRSGPGRGAVLLVLLLALAANATALRNGFTIDARNELTANRFITEPGALVELLSTDAWAGSGAVTGFWRPVTGLADWLLWRASGGRAWSFMLAVSLLHALAVWLAVEVGWRLGFDRTSSLVGAALFAVHPVHCAVLATPLGLKDVLAAALGLAGWLALLRVHESRGTGPATASALAAGVLIALALLAKESAAGIVGAMLAVALFDRFRGGVPRPAARAVVVGWLAIAGAVVVKVAGQFAFAGGGPPDPLDFGSVNPLTMLAPDARMFEAVAHVARYLRLLLAPWPVAPDYAFDTFSLGVRPLSASTLVGMFVLAVLAVLAVGAWRRRCRPAWAALALLAASYLPVSNLVVLVPGSGFAARYMYLPSLAVCWLGALALASWPMPRRLRLAVVAVLAGLGLLGSALQNPTWRDEYRLWTRALEIVPQDMMVAYSAAAQFIDSGETAEAVAACDRALGHEGYAPVLEPVMAGWRFQFRMMRARALLADGRADEALPDARRAVAGRPDRHDWCRELVGRFGRLGAWDEMEIVIEDCARRTGDASVAADLRGLGRRLLLEASDRAWRRTEYGLAARLLERALAAGETDPRARLNLALALLADGEPERAVPVLQELLRDAPDEPLYARHLERALREAGERRRRPADQPR